MVSKGEVAGVSNEIPAHASSFDELRASPLSKAERE
jgi:hypothetical protein